jgi:hypothetical protein
VTRPRRHVIRALDLHLADPDECARVMDRPPVVLLRIWLDDDGRLVYGLVNEGVPVAEALDLVLAVATTPRGVG